MLTRLQLPIATLEILTGVTHDDVDSVSRAHAVLRAGQLSRRMLLLREILDEANGRPAALVRTARLGQAFDLLCWAQRQDPDAVASLLTYPYVGVRLTHWLRRLCAGGWDSGPRWRELAGLAGIAVAAAVRTGREFNAVIPLAAGIAVLPGVGCAMLGTDQDWATVVGDRTGVRIVAGSRSVDIPRPYDRPVPGWHPVRWLSARCGPYVLTAVLDDMDPARDCYGVPPVGWLSPVDHERWRRLVGAAWAELAEYHAQHAMVLSGNPQVLTPLAGSTRHEGVSASVRAGFGAVGLTEPTSPASLAVSLIHEFRHSVLNGIADLIPLSDEVDDRRYYSPWRLDPRPVDGLLHGAFAFLGVADFWRVHRLVTVGESRDQANFEFVRCREQVLQTTRMLADTGRLSQWGERLVTRMAAIAESWAAEPDAAKVVLAARRGIQLHRLAWRVRNVRVDQSDVEAIARAWLRGERAPALIPRTTLIAPTETRFVDDTGWRSLRGTAPGAADASAAIAVGDYRSALRYFRRGLLTDSGSDLTWAGLAHCIATVCGEPAAALVINRPELVAATCRRIAQMQDRLPDPVAVTLWLARPTVPPGLPTG